MYRKRLFAIHKIICYSSEIHKIVLTLLASAAGFVSGLVPQVLKIWGKKQDTTKQLAILDRQIELARVEGAQRTTEAKITRATAESTALYSHDTQLAGAGWVESMRASVRPFLTYAFFALFASVKISALVVLTRQSDIITALPLLWDEPTQVLFAAIVSFWFGNRAISKL